MPLVCGSAQVTLSYKYMHMTTRLALSLVAALGLASCQKESTPPAPSVDFSFVGGSTTGEFTVPTYSDVHVLSQAPTAVAYRWDLGNDSVRTAQSPSFYYTRPGTYTVTLTVQGADRQTATVSKRVRVLERVAKQIVIQNLNDEANSPQHNLVNGTYWVVVRLGENRTQYTQPTSGSPSFEAPILYQSPKVALTSASLPYAFTLPTPLVINYPALRSYTLPTVANRFGYAGVGYGLELYGQDANGTYLLTSSYIPYYRSQSGGISDNGTDFQKNVLQTGYGGVYLKGNFE